MIPRRRRKKTATHYQGIQIKGTIHQHGHWFILQCLKKQNKSQAGASWEVSLIGSSRQSLRINFLAKPSSSHFVNKVKKQKNICKTWQCSRHKKARLAKFSLIGSGRRGGNPQLGFYTGLIKTKSGRVFMFFFLSKTAGKSLNGAISTNCLLVLMVLYLMLRVGASVSAILRSE